MSEETAAGVRNHIQRHDRYGQLSGIELLEVRPGYAKGRMAIDRRHLNSVDTVHGGAIFTLADMVFAAAANSHGSISVAANVSIAFTKAATGGTLTAEAVENNCGRKLGHYTVTVKDDAGALIAVFQGMVYRMKEQLTDYRVKEP